MFSFILQQARHGRMRQRAYQKILGLTKIWVKKRSKKFGQNRVSNSQDIDDMEKCHKDRCFVDKCHFDNYNVFLLISVKDCFRKLKFGQNWVINNLDKLGLSCAKLSTAYAS